MAFSKSQQKVIAAKRPESNYVGGSCEGNMYEKFRKHDTTQRRVYKMFVKGHKLNARRVWGRAAIKSNAALAYTSQFRGGPCTTSKYGQ